MMTQSVLKPDSVLEWIVANYTLTNLLLIQSSSSYKKEMPNKMEDLKANFFNAPTLQIGLVSEILSILWYSKLPCFDIDGKTSEVDGETGLLKLCKWKGKTIPCSKIFKKALTDQGVCCVFNTDDADKIFIKSKYTETIKELQEKEEALAFKAKNLTGWDWYLKNKEPKSQSGSRMGLTLVLDAHSDILTEYSISSDFKEIVAAIIPPGDFPLLSQNPIKLKPGHNNMISVTATVVEADPAIQTYVPPKDRQCYFKDETETIKLHKSYSQFNCLFECSLIEAQKFQNLSCVPWFFPVFSKNDRICDPWEKTRILEAMANDVPENACTHCLPDCSRIVYQPIISTQEFRACDEKNFGMSELCSFESIDVWPQIWGNQVLDQINGTNITHNIVMEKIKSSLRTKQLFVTNDFTFTSVPKEYDAYKDDIAVVNVYFSSPTAMKFSTTINKTWIDFISGIGGNVGLFIGFSFVTVFELIWLIVRVVNIYIMPH
jgi:amiloride-sensitive sodium channel